MGHQGEPLDSSEVVLETASVLDSGVKANVVSYNAVIEEARRKLEAPSWSPAPAPKRHDHQ